MSRRIGWSWVNGMLVTVGVLALLVGLCRLYKANRAPKAVPFLLVGALFCALRWLARLCWHRCPACSSTGRAMVLLTTSLGVAVGALLRVAPHLPDAAHVAEQGARAGWQAGMESALDAAGDRAALNGGGGPP